MRQTPADRRAMPLRLDESPWQHLPEMAQDYRAECAGIEAGLHLLEVYHHHHAKRAVRTDRGNLPARARAHIIAMTRAASLRADIVGAMR